MTARQVTTGKRPQLALLGEAALADATRAAFFQPRFSRDPEAMLHVPLLFWLASALRPAHGVVLGLGEGDLFLALCQALDRLDQTTTCSGVGFWAKEPGRARIPAELSEQIAMLYPGLAEVRAVDDMQAALRRLRKGSVDLLVVDLEHLPDEGLPDPDALRRPLHRDGVLILRGNRQAEPLQPFLEHPAAIRFRARSDLVILPQGEALPGALAPLVTAAPRGEIGGDVNHIFLRLGEGLETSARYRQAVEAGETGKGLSDLRLSHEQRSKRLAQVQVELFTLRARVGEFDAERATLAAERDAEREARFNETAALTRELEAAQSAREAARDELATAQNAKPPDPADDSHLRAEIDSEREARFRETAALTRKLEAMRAENARLSARVAELHESTSWRITAPMRSVGDNLRHRKRRRAARKRK